MQKIIAVSKPSTSNVNVATSSSNSIGTTTPPGTSLINPHIIQIHQPNQEKSPQTAKIQTISTANLSPLQQQSLLQSINKQIRVQNAQSTNQSHQQNLIIKPQVLQQIQKQLQPTQIQLSPVKVTATSLVDTPHQMITTASTTISQPIISRATIKAGTSLIQTSTMTTPISSVRTVSANNPIIGKVITDQTGQIISLENLMQQKQISMPSVRISGAKTGQTANLIQLTSTGSQIAHAYAVVSQPRLLTTQAVNSNASTINSSISEMKLATGISVLSNTNTAAKSEIVKIGPRSSTSIVQSQQNTGQQQLQTTPKIIQSAQLQPITAGKTGGLITGATSSMQLVNAKVLGVQGFQTANQRVKAGTSIRMVNASNLNFANIDGKPVLIASKTPTIIQSPNQQLNNSPQQNQANRSNIVWTQGNNVNTASNINVVNALPTGQLHSTQTPQAVMFGNQIVKINTSNSLTSTGQNTSPRTVVLSSSGQTIKVHTPNLITTSAGAKSNVKVLFEIQFSLFFLYFECCFHHSF